MSQFDSYEQIRVNVSLKDVNSTGIEVNLTNLLFYVEMPIITSINSADNPVAEFGGVFESTSEIFDFVHGVTHDTSLIILTAQS